jgi:Tfp pilus assembly protein PilO
MKKKLAALDMRLQIGLVVLGLILIAAAGYMFVVSPQGAQATKLQTQIDAEQTLIFKRQAEVRAGLHPPTIETADLFKLARAMPDREDMPGIILTLSEVARASGIKFDLIEPVVGGSPAALAGPYTLQRMHLVFNGDFYGLSDYLYRLRSLVAVRDGNLEATGRLFNVDTVTFNVLANSFPQISAELYVDAYIYATPAVAPTTTPSADGTTTTPSTTTPASPDSSLPSSGATASGATP